MADPKPLSRPDPVLSTKGGPLLRSRRRARCIVLCGIRENLKLAKEFHTRSCFVPRRVFKVGTPREACQPASLSAAPGRRHRSPRRSGVPLRPARQPRTEGQSRACPRPARGALSGRTSRNARASGSSAALPLLRWADDHHRDLRALQPATGAAGTAAISRENSTVTRHETRYREIAALLRLSMPRAPDNPARASNGLNGRAIGRICCPSNFRSHPHARSGDAIQPPIPPAPASPKP